MIRTISSDLTTFKTLELHPGLNVLLAIQSDLSSERGTRNGVGKTSLIELVHFLTASAAATDSIFRRDELAPHAFRITADVLGDSMSWSRRGLRHGYIQLELEPNATQMSAFDAVGASVHDNGEVSIRDFQAFLGYAFFGLTPDEPGHPSFSQLFAFFARRERRGGFTDPFKQNTYQSAGDQQLALTYLAGLDWSLAVEWERVRKREDALEAIRRALRDGDMGLPGGSAAEIRSQLVVAARQAESNRENVARFRVVDQYRTLEEEANGLTAQLSSLSDQNAADELLISHIGEVLRSEGAQEPTADRVEELYRQASVELPELVRRRLDEVEQFHRALVTNRRSYLQGELDAARRRVADRQETLERHDRRRAEIFGVLRQSGAIESFVQAQAELARLESTVTILRRQYEAASSVESERVDLSVQRAELLRRLQQNLGEQSERIDNMVVRFQEISSQLYETPGTLVVEPSVNGLNWRAVVPAGLSRGIGNMQVLSFDLTLAVQLADRNTGPMFLLHDSHIFDGVDERQIAAGLRIGAELADSHGFQYLVTLNSDAVPQSIEISKYVLPVTLSDRTEDGGLFGFRFN